MRIDDINKCLAESIQKAKKDGTGREAVEI
jgi:hypothetical protein